MGRVLALGLGTGFITGMLTIIGLANILNWW